jgi:hypothetical protein
MAHAGTVPGGGSPANMALPDAQRRPQTETMAITQGQVPHNAESPPVAPNDSVRLAMSRAQMGLEYISANSA